MNLNVLYVKLLSWILVQFSAILVLSCF